MGKLLGYHFFLKKFLKFWLLRKAFYETDFRNPQCLSSSIKLTQLIFKIIQTFKINLKQSCHKFIGQEFIFVKLKKNLLFNFKNVFVKLEKIERIKFLQTLD